MNIFHPRSYAPSIHHVDYEALRRRGIRALIFDLDNTLCLWRAGPPDARVRKLLKELIAQGFRVAVLSNGRLSLRPEVLAFFEEIGVPVIWPARKPLPRGFKRALWVLKVRPEETAIIGDQLFTDVLGGNLAGLYTVLVTPLDPGRESPFTKLNRILERVLAGRKDPPAERSSPPQETPHANVLAKPGEWVELEHTDLPLQLRVLTTDNIKFPS